MAGKTRVIVARGVVSPSHGENRGSSPLGSANDFSNLAQKRSLVWPASPTFLQWTVLQTIGSRSRCDRRLEEVGSDLRHRRAGIGAKPASVLRCLRSASRRCPVEQIEHASELFSLRSCRQVCPRVGSPRAEARRNRSPQAVPQNSDSGEQNKATYCFGVHFSRFRLASRKVAPIGKGQRLSRPSHSRNTRRRSYRLVMRHEVFTGKSAHADGRKAGRLLYCEGATPNLVATEGTTT